jgi:hypothetical protein
VRCVFARAAVQCCLRCYRYRARLRVVSPELPGGGAGGCCPRFLGTTRNRGRFFVPVSGIARNRGEGRGALRAIPAPKAAPRISSRCTAPLCNSACRNGLCRGPGGCTTTYCAATVPHHYILMHCAVLLHQDSARACAYGAVTVVAAQRCTAAACAAPVAARCSVLCVVAVPLPATTHCTVRSRRNRACSNALCCAGAERRGDCAGRLARAAQYAASAACIQSDRCVQVLGTGTVAGTGRVAEGSGTVAIDCAVCRAIAFKRWCVDGCSYNSV